MEVEHYFQESKIVSYDGPCPLAWGSERVDPRKEALTDARVHPGSCPERLLAYPAFVQYTTASFLCKVTSTMRRSR